MADCGRRSRKVLFLLPSLSGGGAERVASLLIQPLSERFEVTLVLLEDRRAYTIPDRVPCVAFSGPLGGKTAHLTRTPHHLFSLVRLVRQTGARVALSFMEQANILNIMAARITGHKAIVSQRIVPRLQARKNGLLGALIYACSRALYPKSAHVTTVSAKLRDVMVREFGIPQGHVSFIPNPVDSERLFLESQTNPCIELPEKYIVHVGRLFLRQKGQDLLLRAFSSCRESLGDLSLVLVGEGPDRPDIEALIDRLDLSGRIQLCGWQERIAPIMVGAEALVLCSHYEGWPNVLVEAMACGCPVIATDCESGPREILDGGRYGALVPAGDETALARELVKVACRDNDIGAVKLRAVSRARDFAVDKIADRYADLIWKVGWNP